MSKIIDFQDFKQKKAPECKTKNKLQESFDNINTIVNVFVREILVSLNADLDSLCLKCGIENTVKGACYQIGLYHTGTKVTVIKCIDPIEFLMMGVNKKLEPVINQSVKDILTVMKRTTKSDKVILI